MSVRKTSGGRQKVEIPQGEQTVFPPLAPRLKPKPTAEDRAQQAEIMRLMREIHKNVTETNLLRVRRLVDMGLRGQLPEDLLEHLSLLGRDWYKLADNGPSKPDLRVIEGGAD